MRQIAEPTHRRCICPSCGEAFSTVSNFDRHRVGQHGAIRSCVEPSTAGLIERHCSTGHYWSMPGPVKPVEAFAEQEEVV